MNGLLGPSFNVITMAIFSRDFEGNVEVFSVFKIWQSGLTALISALVILLEPELFIYIMGFSVTLFTYLLIFMYFLLFIFLRYNGGRLVKKKAEEDVDKK